MAKSTEFENHIGSPNPSCHLLNRGVNLDDHPTLVSSHQVVTQTLNVIVYLHLQEQLTKCK